MFTSARVPIQTTASHKFHPESHLNFLINFSKSNHTRYQLSRCRRCAVVVIDGGKPLRSSACFYRVNERFDMVVQLYIPTRSKNIFLLEHSKKPALVEEFLPVEFVECSGACHGKKNAQKGLYLQDLRFLHVLCCFYK